MFYVDISLSDMASAVPSEAQRLRHARALRLIAATAKIISMIFLYNTSSTGCVELSCSLIVLFFSYSGVLVLDDRG